MVAGLISPSSYLREGVEKHQETLQFLDAFNWITKIADVETWHGHVSLLMPARAPENYNKMPVQ